VEAAGSCPYRQAALNVVIMGLLPPVSKYVGVIPGYSAIAETTFSGSCCFI
jgi:hypothetical protein